MKVVILAAGRGSRMDHHTQHTTKAMLPIIDPIDNIKKPMLQITVERCIQCGLREFIIVVGYRANDIIHFFTNEVKHNLSIPITFKFIEQVDIVAGTADAVNCVREQIPNDRFLLIYGDVVPTTNTITRLIANNDIKMAVRRVEDPSKYGVVETCDDHIIRILEKTPNPPTNLVNAGIYILDGRIFDYIAKTPRSSRGEFELTTSLQLFIDDEIQNEQKINEQKINEQIQNEQIQNEQKINEQIYKKQTQNEQKIKWYLIDDNNLDIGTKSIYEDILKVF